MKRQLILLISGVMGALSFSTVAIANSSPQASINKAHQPQLLSTKGRSGPALSAVSELNLTANQEVEIEAIRAGVYDQMAEILDPDQLETLQTAMSNGDNMRSVVMGLGLSRSEMSSLRNIVGSVEDDIMEVLTPEQRSQLEGDRPRDRN